MPRNSQHSNLEYPVFRFTYQFPDVENMFPTSVAAQDAHKIVDFRAKIDRENQRGQNDGGEGKAVQECGRFSGERIGTGDA